MTLRTQSTLCRGTRYSNEPSAWELIVLVVALPVWLPVWLWLESKRRRKLRGQL